MAATSFGGPQQVRRFYRTALAEWPAFLRQALSPRRVARVHRVTVPDNYALERLARVVVGAVEGERNSLTFWAACRAGEMVASGLLDADLAVELIARAATKSGLSAAEAERTAWSGIRTTAGGRHG